MAKKPKLAIVGRPNVGKSALFNRICGMRIAIVDEAEGITRDRLYHDTDCFGVPFQVIDTGGINRHSSMTFNDEVKWQAEVAIEEADALMMVVDARTGVTTLDVEVAQILFRTKKPVCLAVNKIDDRSHEHLMHQFYSLGIERMMPVSAVQGYNIAELLQLALQDVQHLEEEDEERGTRIAIVGRPNAGKSTLINYFLDEKRCIVSPIAGTTRDSVDISFEYENEAYTLIDTAGIRRKHAEHEVVDKFAAIRTQRAIERADICLFILDAQQGLTTQEKKIAKQIGDSGKGCILLFNKWDLVKGHRMEHCQQAIFNDMKFLQHCPTLFISALSGRNINDIFPIVQRVQTQVNRRISTPDLNRFISESLQQCHPPMITGKRLRIYYMVQVDTAPPRFLLFVNRPDLMVPTYEKYLLNQFRKTFGFEGVPVVFHTKGKERNKKNVTQPVALAPTGLPEGVIVT